MDPDTDWVSSKWGYALDFDGTNDQVNCGAVYDDLGANPFSVVALVKTISAVQKIMILGKYGTGLNDGFFLSVNRVAASGLVYLNTTTSTADEEFVESATTINDGFWHLVVATRASNGNLSIYIDGKLDGFNNTTTIKTFPANLGLAFIIGDLAANYWNHFPGQISTVLFYDRALTKEEVSQLYHDTFAMFRYPFPIYFPPVPTATSVLYLTSATANFLNLQSGMARPYWEVNITVSGGASTTSGILGHAYSPTNDIISMGTIDREKPIEISGLSRIFAGNLTMSLNNQCGTYSPLATGSIFTDAGGSARDYMHSIINIWAGFMDTSGTAYTVQRGSFLLTRLQIDSANRKAYITAEDAAKIPLSEYVGLPDSSGTATTWEPPSGIGTKVIMTELASAVGLSSTQYSFASGLDFGELTLEEEKVSDAMAELAQANDGYIYTNGKGEVVFALNRPVWGGKASDLTLKDTTRISKSRYTIDIKNLINKVQIKYTSGLAETRTDEDATVTKGRTQIISNELIDRASIANSLGTKLLTQFKKNRPFLELDNVWLPSLEVGNIIDVYDTNTYSTGISYEIYRIREDITKLSTKLYCIDITDNEIYGTNKQKWGFVSSSDVANCGTNFTGSWSSGFAFACSSTAFDAEGDNDGVVESGVGSGGGIDGTGIELPFLTY